MAIVDPNIPPNGRMTSPVGWNSGTAANATGR